MRIIDSCLKMDFCEIGRIKRIELFILHKGNDHFFQNLQTIDLETVYVKK